MRLLYSCFKPSLPPLSFVLGSRFLPPTVLPQCLRLLSHYPTVSRINLEQNLSFSPLIDNSSAVVLSEEQNLSFSPLIDNSSAVVLSEETCRHLIAYYKSISPKQGTCVHSPIIKLGVEGNLLLCNDLLSLYSKHGQTNNAYKVFEEMPFTDIVSWTAIISAFVQSGNGEEALCLYQEMLFTGLVPNHFTLSSIVRCAASLRDFDLGTSLHALIIKRGFRSNPILESGLLDFYSKCGMFNETCQFEFTAVRDTISWTTMISASVKAGEWRNTICLYMRMLKDGVFPNEFTFTRLLSACSNLESGFGELLHAHVIVLGIDLNLTVKTALVDMYSKCKKMIDATNSLLLTSDSDVMLSTAIISGFARAGDCDKAVSYFQKMQTAEAMSPNSFTYATLINASSLAARPELGRLFHCLVVKAGIEHDVSVGNAIVDLYSKWCPQSDDAVRAFEEISSPNIVSWTALIDGVVRQGDSSSAMAMLAEMQAAGVRPNSFTLSTILTKLRSPEAAPYAQKLHADVLKTNLGTRDITVGNSLVDAYAKLGMPEDVWKVFHDVPQRDFCTYTSLIACLNHAGLHQQALSMIVPLRAELRSIDGFSLASFLSAAAGLAAAKCGRQLHCHSIKSCLDAFTSVLNGLVDMYGKCGHIDEARSVFALIQQPNVVSWNGLISVLASNGHFVDSLSTFEDMRMTGALPDSVTVLITLYACSHGGLVDLGISYFNSMEEQFGLVPDEDHYVCLVDMLGRAGRLEEAVATIGSMVHKPGAVVYKTLLGCCRLHGNVAMGEWAASRALEMHPLDSSVYVQLAGMYDDAGRVDLGEQIRKMMRERGATKSPGRSWM